jgi:hypothetical protein
MPFCHSYILYVFVISIYGCFNGFVTLEAIVLVELFGKNKLTDTMAISVLKFQAWGYKIRRIFGYR